MAQQLCREWKVAQPPKLPTRSATSGTGALAFEVGSVQNVLTFETSRAPHSNAA